MEILSGGERKHEAVEQELPDAVTIRGRRDRRWCGGVPGREHDASGWQYWFGPCGGWMTTRGGRRGREFEYQRRYCLRCGRRVGMRCVYVGVPPNAPGSVVAERW